MNTPQENLDVIISTGVAKAVAPVRKLLIFGFLAGVFIAFAAAASTMASMNLLSSPDTYGLGRLVTGVVFVGGLAMTILAGGELFTGNVLMIAALLNKKIVGSQVLRNWCLVLLANIAGGIFIAWLISLTGLFNANTSLFGATTIKIATSKSALDFLPAFTLGILCNFLVCLAVWMATATKSVSGKIAAIFFPITTFVVLGLEHSVANAYYIPAGLFASTDPALVESAENIGANTASLNVVGLFDNLITVILGNLIGGGLFVATAYYLALQPAKR